MKHLQKLSLTDFKELVEQVKQKCKEDYEKDAPLLDNEPFSWSKISRVGDFYDYPFEYSLAYYLLKNPKVYNFLVDLYVNKGKISAKDVANKKYERINKFLKERVNSGYLNRKMTSLETGPVVAVNMQTPYNTIFHLYLDDWTIYTVYYYSAKYFRVNTFELRLNLKIDKAEVYGLHDEFPVSYSGRVVSTGSTLFINLERKDVDAKEQLHLFINRGKQEIARLNDVPGSFQGVSFEDSGAISGEFFLLRKQLLATKDSLSLVDYDLQIRRHLNLNRNSYRAYKGSLFNEVDYNSQYNYTLDVLEKHKGSYFAAHMKDRHTMVVSILELSNNYQTTLINPEIEGGKPLNCPIRITKGESQAVLLEVYLKQPEKPFILALINLPFAKNPETLEGCYCNIMEAPKGGVLLLRRHTEGVTPNPSPATIDMTNPLTEAIIYQKLWEGLVQRNPFM